MGRRCSDFLVTLLPTITDILHQQERVAQRKPEEFQFVVGIAQGEMFQGRQVGRGRSGDEQVGYVFPLFASVYQGELP